MAFRIALLVGFAASLVMLAFGARRVVEQLRRRRILARLAPTTEVRQLAESLGRDVVVEGVLQEPAALATTFSGAAYAVEEPHPRAVTTAQGNGEPRIVVGTESIALGEPIQVVLGSDERRSYENGDVATRRTVRRGDRVRVVGRLARASIDANEALYRDRKWVYEIAPPPGDAPHPVTTIYVDHGERGITAVAFFLVPSLMLAGATAFAAYTASVRPPGATPGAADEPSFVRPACGEAVDRLLEASDPWAARTHAQTCDDVEGTAEAAWMMGDAAGANAAFTLWRARDPLHRISAAEAESAMIVDHAEAATLLRAMKTDWYRGPRDTGQQALDCIDAALRKPSYQPCAAGPAREIYWNANALKNVELQPNYALHDPSKYARFVPLLPQAVRDVPRVSELRTAFQAVRIGNLADKQLLHAAITGETDAYADAAAQMDNVSSSLAALDQAHLTAADSDYGPPPTPAEMLEERDSIRFDAQRDLAVAATAAYLARDEPRMQAFLARSEAHARAILEEQLAIVAGTAKGFSPSHHPSDYGDIDMHLFEIVDEMEPDAFAAQLKNAQYTSPACLEGLLTHRPALQAAVRRAMDTGYLAVPRDAGLYTMLDAAFRRRFAAMLVGDKELEAKWLGVTRGFGAALRANDAYFPLVSLESLLTTSD